MSELFQRSFSDPEFAPQLFEFLDTIFPGLLRTTSNCRALGASWESVSTPFVYFRDGRIIAHVGVLELPLVVMGKEIVAAGIHGVATDPRFRRQGYYRRIMDEVMQYCDPKYETLILTTEQSSYYEPFGFRVIPEYSSSVTLSGRPGCSGFRRLHLQLEEDRRLLQRHLESRAPISNILGVVREKAVFCFNESARPVHYSSKLDCTVCMEIEGESLKLYDVVAPAMPTLQEILSGLPVPLTRAQIFFAADKLNLEAPHHQAFRIENTCLIARGPFPPEGQICMLPRSARC